MMGMDPRKPGSQGIDGRSGHANLNMSSHMIAQRQHAANMQEPMNMLSEG